MCANVAQDFKDQWAAILTANTQGSANDASESNLNILDSRMSTQTLEIVTRIENSVVEAITEIHKSNQDGKIEKLMNDLANEKTNDIQLEEINSKIFDLIEANAYNTKLLAENENNISNQIGKLSERLTKISKASDDLSTGLTFINEKTAELSHALKVTCNTMSDNISSNEAITENLKIVAQSLTHNTETVTKFLKLNTELSNSARSGQRTQDEQREQDVSRTIKLDVKTSNRFNPLESMDEFDREDHHEVPNARKKVLLMGNSHMKNIRINNYFLHDSLIHKYVVFDFNEVIDNLSDIDNDYDVLFLHLFTNEVRNSAPDVCVENCAKFIEKLCNHCQFSKRY